MLEIVDSSIEDFISRVKGKGVYCFGAGEGFKNFAAAFPQVRILAVIDNFQKGEIQAGEKSYRLLSMDELEIHDISQTVFVITSARYCDEIIRQLDKIEKFNGLICYVELLLRTYREKVRSVPRSSCEREMIPRKIHYCWFGNHPIPDEYLVYMESWKKYCPDFEIIQWNDSNYDVAKNEYLRLAYSQRKWAFVSDYARIDILYRYGGVYLDTDVELLRPIDELLKWDLFCGFESRSFINAGLGMGARKGLGLLKYTLERYENLEEVYHDGQFVTCPVVQSQVMEKFGFRLDGTFQVIGNMAVYPEAFFSPYSYKVCRREVDPQAFSIHHFAGSWLKDRKNSDSRVEKNLQYLMDRLQKEKK